MQLHRPFLTLLLTATSIWSAASTTHSLGLVTADGDFKLNQAVVRGNATLTGDDALVETLAVPSRISLRGGATLRLDAGSAARIHIGRVTVERGSGEWNAAGGPDALEALTLRIAAEPGASASARFLLASGNTVQLSASRGRFRVMNAHGTLVSRLEPGLALAFAPQQGLDGAMAPSSFIGCIVNKNSKWILYEPALKLIVELRGQSSTVEREWGNRVQINGTSPTSGQPEGRQLMNVTSVTRIEVGGCEEMATAAGAQLPAQPAAAPAASTTSPTGASTRPPVIPTRGAAEGMSAGTKYGIVAAVVGGGAVAGIAAASGKRSR